MGEKNKSTDQLEAPQAKRARTIEASLVVDLTEEDPPLTPSTGVLIQDEPLIDPSEFINIRLPPSRSVPPPPTTSFAPYNSSATVSDPIIRELINGDHKAEVDSSTTVVVPPVDPVGEPHISLSDIITQMAQIVTDSAGAQPEPTIPPQVVNTDQQECSDLNMADSAHQQTLSPSPPENFNRSVTSGKPL